LVPKERRMKESTEKWEVCRIFPGSWPVLSLNTLFEKMYLKKHHQEYEISMKT
jgi:hypothetical protein